jgi:uncharacterized membrane protein YeaQ/YmgE (transglycosylase-associated protein family)
VSKSNRRTPFGSSSRGGVVNVIETPVARNYRRRAVIAFWLTLGVVGLLAGTVASDHMHPILGFGLGALIGAVLGAVVFVLIVSWPVLRAFWHWLPEILLGSGLTTTTTNPTRTEGLAA